MIAGQCIRTGIETCKKGVIEQRRNNYVWSPEGRLEFILQQPKGKGTFYQVFILGLNSEFNLVLPRCLLCSRFQSKKCRISEKDAYGVCLHPIRDKGKHVLFPRWRRTVC